MLVILLYLAYGSEEQRFISTSTWNFCVFTLQIFLRGKYVNRILIAHSHSPFLFSKNPPFVFFFITCLLPLPPPHLIHLNQYCLPHFTMGRKPYKCNILPGGEININICSVNSHVVQSVRGIRMDPGLKEEEPVSIHKHARTNGERRKFASLDLQSKIFSHHFFLCLVNQFTYVRAIPSLLP